MPKTHKKLYPKKIEPYLHMHKSNNFNGNYFILYYTGVNFVW